MRIVVDSFSEPFENDLFCNLNNLRWCNDASGKNPMWANDEARSWSQMAPRNRGCWRRCQNDLWLRFCFGDRRCWWQSQHGSNSENLKRTLNQKFRFWLKILNLRASTFFFSLKSFLDETNAALNLVIAFIVSRARQLEVINIHEVLNRESGSERLHARECYVNQGEINSQWCNKRASFRWII